MRQFLSLTVLFSILLFSCKEEETPDSRVPVTIEGFSLVNSNTGARLLADGEWTHPFGEKVSLVFVSQTTQESHPVSFKPDFSGELPQILLPPGSYSYSGSTASLRVSEFLPVDLEGTLQVTVPTSVSLSGKTAYQLVSFHQDNITQESEITQPAKSPFFSQGDYRYAYVVPNEVFKADLVLSSGKTINWGLDAQAFSHDSYFFKTANSSSPAPALSDPLLELSQSSITLDQESIPGRMPLFYQTELDSKVKEASALQFDGQRLYAINDGDNAAEIYEVDLNQGTAVRTIRVTNAENIDWEDLASNGEYLYIGDFGNNLGTRKDLRILRISRYDLAIKNEVEADVIHFSYERQTWPTGSDHRFDCEAMVYQDGLLLLFTKPTNAQGSDIYTLSATPGTRVAQYAGTFETEGWITGADITRDGQNLVFVGYENKGFLSQAFLGLIKNAHLPGLSGNSLKTIRLGSVAATSQVEGISIDANQRVKIAGEQISQSGLTVPQRLSELDLKGILEN